jgi:hypothetical protein
LIHTNQEAQELEIDGYKGGRTEAFFLGNVPADEITCVDVNSLYPFVMKNNEFPTKLVGIERFPTMKSLMKDMEKYLVIADVDLEISEPAIGKKGDRLIFPIGTFRSTITSPEIKLVLEYGRITKIHSYAIYAHAPIFQKWVDEMYGLRQKYKEEGNFAFQMMVKTLLNSLYGKFGQRVMEMNDLGDDKRKDGRYEFFDLDERKKKYIYVLGNKAWMTEQTRKASYDSNISIAAFVTAYARCYLWKLMTVAGKHNYFYADTDSLYVNIEGLNNLVDYIDNKELGKLKIEGTANTMIIYGAKDYTFGDYTKIKGIKHDAVQITENSFEQIKFQRIKTAIIKGTLDKQIISKTTKVLKREYEKGTKGEDGWVIPFDLSLE